jgi:alanyl-tRNA synthetase
MVVVSSHRDTAYRIIADHVRTLTFAIADGAVPSNEGRGYVLRRILRRAVRYGVQTLHAPPGFFAQLVPVLVQQMRSTYPELAEKQDEVVRVVSEEEAAFSTLLQRGVKYFNELLADMRAKGQTVVGGDKAFLLYDSLGFPIDLTQIMAAEAGVTVDLEGFQAAMQEQQQRGRQAAIQKRLGNRVELALGAEQTAYLRKNDVQPTNDSAKYTWDTPLTTTVKALYTTQGFQPAISASADSLGVVLEATPFYAEAGGQAADTGTLSVTKSDSTVVELDVVDVQVIRACHLISGVCA